MKPGIPWSVKGIEPEVREAAKHAARKAGLTLGEWLNTVILDQSDDDPTGNQADDMTRHEEFSEAAGHLHHRDEGTVRLEDIANQLSQLASRERESAAIMPYEMPRPRPQDTETLNRILNRIDSNERQAVEAFTAMNERLGVLGRQIAALPKPQALEKPEDVPGFTSLEGAIRNVVEHIEVAEKRTRDGLKSMQDRLAELSQRPAQIDGDEILRVSPAFTALEARLAEMAARLQRSDSHVQALPELVRKEMGQFNERLEQVRKASEAASARAQAEAAVTAQRELRDIETRIASLLKETQASMQSQSASAADVQRLRGDLAVLGKRVEEAGSSAARDRDVQALRVAVEQLSARVAQGPDNRPIVDMDRRLADLSQRLEQSTAQTRNLPQFGELERRIAEIDHRLGEAVRLQGDGQALVTLEQHLGDFGQRLASTEAQLGNLGVIEQAINQLYQGLEDNRGFASQVAEEAANRAAERVMAAQQARAGEPSEELQALRDGLQAVRESASHADQRNQETLEAVHETLEQIVNKLAELETATAGHQIAATMAQQAMAMPTAAAEPAWAPPPPAPEPSPQMFFDPAGAFEPPAPEPTLQPQLFQQPASAPEPPPFHASPAGHGDAPEPHQPEPQAAAVSGYAQGLDPGLDGDDDFIAAARRAAHAAATRSNGAGPDHKLVPKPGANRGFKLSLPFLKPKGPPPITYVGGKPVVESPGVPAQAGSLRRKLILAGIVLLAAVSAVGFNLMARGTKPVKQSFILEQPVTPAAPVLATAEPPVMAAKTAPAGEIDGLAADPLVTGSLPSHKTDASLASIVAEPGAALEAAGMPDEGVGALALREAAARGDAKAQFIVGSRYVDGQGVERDYPKAAQWYQLAAARGLAPAQYRLATLFERGKGVPQDLATALLWYERAAEAGNVKAMHNAAVIAAGNMAGAPNYDKAFRWFKQAAERGLADSQFNLAVLYERGLGAKIDKPMALLWYNLAGRQGDTDAAKRAGEISATMAGAEVAAVNVKVNGWQPLPVLDDANVVAVTNAAWTGGTAPLTSSEDIATPPPAENALAAPLFESVPAEEPVNPVQEAQELLTRLGFNIGAADGQMGTRTQNAIRLFQLQSGLKVTGEVTPELLDAMRAKTG